MARKKTIPLLIVIVACVLIYVCVSLINGSRNAAFMIEGTYYSKGSISNMASFAAKVDGLSKAQEVKNIFAFYETKVAAQKANIIPNDSELQAATKSMSIPKATTSDQKEYVSLIEFNSALTQAYHRYAQGGYQGSEFVFDFSQRVLPSPVGETPTAGQGNAALIKQDRDYAQKQAESYYSNYKKGGISPDTMNAQLKAKQKLGFTAGVSTFDSSLPADLRSQIYYSDIYSYVLSQTGPGLSSLKVGKVETKLNPSTLDYADGYYYFVKLTKAQQVVSDPNGKVTAQEKKLQVEFYGI